LKESLSASTMRRRQEMQDQDDDSNGLNQNEMACSIDDSELCPYPVACT
jgi:hypothetical protein